MNTKEKALEYARLTRIYIKKFKNAEREVMVRTRAPKFSVEYNDITPIIHGMFQHPFPGLVIPQSLVRDAKIIEKEFVEFYEKKFSVDVIGRARLLKHFRLAVSVEERLYRIFMTYARQLK